MKPRKALTAVTTAVCLLLWCGAVSAQTLPQPMVDVARKAVENNPEIQSKWHNFTASDREADAAKAGYRPQVDLIAKTGREWLQRPDLVTSFPPSGIDNYYRNGVGITLTQMLFDGFFTKYEVQRFSYAKLVRYYELLESSENTALEAIRAYTDVAKQIELVDAAKDNYVEHKLITQLIEERADAGVSRRVDLEQANGRLALAESNLITEVSNLHDVSARYLRVIGETPSASTPPLPERMDFSGVPTSGAQALGDGLVNSPTINAAYENVRAARSLVESRKSAYYPRLDLRAGDSYDRNYLGIIGNTRDSYIELVLSYNLYRGGGDVAREKQAVELQYQARDLQEKACRDVRQTLAIAYNDVVRLKDQLTYLNQHRLSTEKSRVAYRQQFEIGQRTLLDMLNTQNEYFEASRAYTNARYNEFMAQARTLSSMGKLTTALGVTRDDQPTASDVGQDRGDLPAAELCPYDLPPMPVIDKAALLAEAVPMHVRTLPAKMTFSADALFDFDKSDLKPEGMKSMDDLAAKLKGANYDVVIAVGHTDAVGTEAYNQALSQRRADSVRNYLVSKGLPAERIRAEGKGKLQPIASNDTAEGRAKNRRVEIQVVQSSAPAKK